MKNMACSFVKLAAQTLLLTTFLSSSADAAPQTNTLKSIRIFNQSSFTDSAIREYLTEHAPKSHIALLTDKRYVLYVFTDDIQLNNSKNVFLAKIGLTSPTTDGRNNRDPGYSAKLVDIWHKPETLEKAELEARRAETLREALDAFLKIDTTKLVSSIEYTFSEGVRGPAEPADESRVRLESTGLDSVAKTKIFDLFPDEWSKKFDYRKVALNVTSFNQSFDNGSAFCWAVASVIARPPQGRNARIADISARGYYEMSADQVRERGGIEKCKQEAAVLATKELFQSPWNSTGIFKNFAKTRETGVPLPNFDQEKSTVAARPVANNVRERTANTQDKNCHYVRDTTPETSFQEQCDWGTTGPQNCRQVPTTNWKSEDKLVCD